MKTIFSILAMVATTVYGEAVLKDVNGVEYIAVEYLESDGNQWIDTGYIHNGKTVVDMKVAITQYPSGGSWYSYFGARTSNRASNQFGAWVHGGIHYSAIGQKEYDLTELKYVLNEPFNVRLDLSGDCYIDGNMISRSGVAIASGFRYTDFLFAINQSGDPSFASKARIYWCVIREDEVTMRDFIPVKRKSDGKVGMLDRAYGKFYVNAGNNADFTAGPVVVAAPITAIWTGAAKNGEISDAANWNCKDSSGAVLDNVVPNELTRTIILEADADWRNSSSALASRVATIDLNGHELKVASVPEVLAVTDYYGKYEFLEYLETNNADSECPFIDTHYRHSSTTKADLKVAFTSLPASGRWFAYIGGRPSHDNEEQFGGWIHNVNGKTYHYSGMTKTESDVTSLGNVVLNQPYTIHLDNNAGAVSTVDGKDLVVGNGKSSQHTVLLFGCADHRDEKGYGDQKDVYGRVSFFAHNFVGTCRIYYCKLWTGDKLERDFVPVRRLSDGELGMLDRTSWKFYGNANYNNTKSFVAGPVQETVTHRTKSGQLIIEIADGVANNKLTEFSGSIKLVKAGAGTLIASKMRQTYCGGTEVLGGVLKAGTDLNLFTPLGSKGSVVVFGPGTELDVNARYAGYLNNGLYKYILAGAKISNAGGDISASNAQMTDIELTEDSMISALSNFALVGNAYSATSINLGGKKLNVELGSGKTFTCCNTSVSEGTITTSGDGSLGLGSESSSKKSFTSFKGEGVNLVVNSGFIVWEPASVKSYEARYTKNDRNLGSGKLNVIDVFKPVGSGFYAPVMQNGSTIDISEWDSKSYGWPIYSRSTAGNVQLSFANNATIAVNLKDRADLFKLAREKTYLLKWGTSNETRTTRPENTVFKVDDYSSSRYIYLEQDDVGLKVMRHGGLTIRIF